MGVRSSHRMSWSALWSNESKRLAQRAHVVYQLSGSGHVRDRGYWGRLYHSDNIIEKHAASRLRWCTFFTAPIVLKASPLGNLRRPTPKGREISPSFREWSMSLELLMWLVESESCFEAQNETISRVIKIWWRFFVFFVVSFKISLRIIQYIVYLI